MLKLSSAEDYLQSRGKSKYSVVTMVLVRVNISFLFVHESISVSLEHCLIIVTSVFVGAV